MFVVLKESTLGDCGIALTLKLTDGCKTLGSNLRKPFNFVL